MLFIWHNTICIFILHWWNRLIYTHKTSGIICLNVNHVVPDTHTYTQTHTHRGKERGRELVSKHAHMEVFIIRELHYNFTSQY